MNPFLEVIDALNGSGERYVIVGGFAAVMHGVNRMTHDLDIVVDLAPGKPLPIVRALLAAGFRPKAPVDAELFADDVVREAWAREKNMLVFPLAKPSQPYFAVDVFVKEPIPFELLDVESVEVDVQGRKARVCSVEHLKRLKLEAGRDRDLADIKALEMIERGGM